MPRVRASMGSTLRCPSVATRTLELLATCMLPQRRPTNCLASFTVDCTILQLWGCDSSPSMVHGVGQTWPFTRLPNWSYRETMFHCTKTGKWLPVNIVLLCIAFDCL